HRPGHHAVCPDRDHHQRAGAEQCRPQHRPNAMFNIQQRGAGPWTANFSFTADRWALFFSADTMSATIGAQTDASRTAIGDEAAISFLGVSFTGTAGATAHSRVYHNIEGVRRLAGKTVTVSFYAQTASGTRIGVSLSQGFGSGGSPSAGVDVNGQSVVGTG